MLIVSKIDYVCVGMTDVMEDTSYILKTDNRNECCEYSMNECRNDMPPCIIITNRMLLIT